MITHSYIEVSGSGHSIEDMTNRLVADIFDKLNKVVPFNRIYESPSKYDGNKTIFEEKYELIDGKILEFIVEIPLSFCLSSTYFIIRQCITNVTNETESYLFPICSINQSTIGFYTVYQDPNDYTCYYNISCTFLYTMINNENCNLFYMRNPSQEYCGFVGTYKIEDKIFCVAKETKSTVSSVIWDEEDNIYYIAPLMNNGITTDKDDNFMTMPVYLANSNIINTTNPTLIYTDYVFKDWLLADSYHCIPKSTYTVDGINYYCHHFSTSSGKYSLLIKI